MADIEQIDATQGAGEPLYLGFAKANQVITKINAIEAGATQDQSGAEIKALLEALVDKLSIAAVKETDTKKVLTATERTKLAGIEANAKDDQTGAEIKALLEALADKLSIETGVKETTDKKIMTATERANVAANVVDVAAAQADIDGFPNELKNLITHEIQQLETLGDTITIVEAQWGFLGDMSYGVSIGNIPAFLVEPAGIQTDIAVGEWVAVVWGTEIFDIGGNFTGNVFTAPVTGKYQVNVYLRLNNVDIDSTYVQFRFTTSNRSYYSTLDFSKFSADVAYFPLNFAVIADMDAADTASVDIWQQAGIAQMDIDTESKFSGVLVA